MKVSVAQLRLDLMLDINKLRDQVAELPGIRARLEEQGKLLAAIKDLLTTFTDRLGSGTV